MKALVAATCVAVLATVGYYFWGEYLAMPLGSRALQKLRGS